MSTYCEVSESIALATSSCPATDVVMVVLSEGSSFSNLDGSGPISLPVSTANATSQVNIEAYAVMTSAADAQSTISHTLAITSLLKSAANGASSVVQAFNQMAQATANAQSEIAASTIPQVVVSTAVAISSVEANTHAAVSLMNEAAAYSSVTLGLREVCIGGAAAVSSVTVLRRVFEIDSSNANATSDTQPTVTPGTFLLVSSADSFSVVELRTDRNLFVSSETANAFSSVWFRNPDSKAWLMATETSAVGWYDNFEFESIAQVGNKTLAVGPDGLYELAGDLDDGVKIKSRVQSGFTDFGQAQTKRLDAMYFGYTSDGQIAVQTEVEESGNAPATYMLEERLAESPRNSRVVPGKGLWGRYWRLTITNVDGANFKVSDASVDIAVSMRRV